MTTAEIAKLDSAIARRVTAEHRVARRIALAAIADGKWVSIHNGEYGSAPVRTWKALRPELFACECETLFICEPTGTGKFRKVGWIDLVWGNSPEELICDYSDSEVIEKYCRAGWGYTD